MSYPSDPFPPRPPAPPSGSYGSVPSPPGPPTGPPTGPPVVPGPPGPVPASAPGRAAALGGFEVASPPIGWIVAAIGAGVAALAVVLAFRGSIEWAVVGWVIAGPVAIGLLAGFTIHNIRRQTSPLYDDRGPLVPSLYWPAVVVAGAGVAISAWYIADWVGRL